MIVPELLKSVEQTAVELAQLHKLDPGEPMTMFSDISDIDPMSSLDEVDGLATAAAHLAAVNIYKLEMAMHVLLESGSTAERDVVHAAQCRIFMPFWQLLLFRHNPASCKDPFPVDLDVPAYDFATGMRRERNERGNGDTAVARPWLDVIEDCLDLLKGAAECLQAHHQALDYVDSQQRWAKWDQVKNASKRARVVEV